MSQTISLSSIKKANGRLMRRKSGSFSSDGETATIGCRTLRGKRRLSLSKKKIINAANNAMKQYSLNE